jgi:hypothetical protein
MQRCRAWHRSVTGFIVSRPIILIPLVPVYLSATIVVAFLCGLAGKGLHLALSLSPYTDRYAAYDIAKTLFVPFAPWVWLHYIWLALCCFRAAIGLRMAIYPVIQLVVVTVFIFAAAHYYTALFTDNPKTPAYNGITNPHPEDGWRDAADFNDRLFFCPPLDTMIDFFYFSTVTTATVGYGDITPATPMAKLVTITHIGVSFVLIVVVLGWVIGNAKSLADQAVKNQH